MLIPWSSFRARPVPAFRAGSSRSGPAARIRWAHGGTSVSAASDAVPHRGRSVLCRRRTARPSARLTRCERVGILQVVLALVRTSARSTAGRTRCEPFPTTPYSCSAAAARCRRQGGGAVSAVPPPLFLLGGPLTVMGQHKLKPPCARPHTESLWHRQWGVRVVPIVTDLRAPLHAFHRGDVPDRGAADSLAALRLSVGRIFPR